MLALHSAYYVAKDEEATYRLIHRGFKPAYAGCGRMRGAKGRGMDWAGSKAPRIGKGDPEWCGKHGRPHAAESPPDAKKKPAAVSAPTQSTEFPTWVYHDTAEDGCFVAQVRRVAEVADGDHAGKDGIWFERIRKRLCREDWALLSDFEGRLASEEYTWVGKGEVSKRRAKAMYLAASGQAARQQAPVAVAAGDALPAALVHAATPVPAVVVPATQPAPRTQLPPPGKQQHVVPVGALCEARQPTSPPSKTWHMPTGSPGRVL